MANELGSSLSYIAIQQAAKRCSFVGHKTHDFRRLNRRQKVARGAKSLIKHFQFLLFVLNRIHQKGRLRDTSNGINESIQFNLQLALSSCCPIHFV